MAKRGLEELREFVHLENSDYIVRAIYMAVQYPRRSASKGNAADKIADKTTGQALEFISAVPGRRYGKFAGLLDDFQRQCVLAGAVGDMTEITGEIDWNGLRLVVAHDPVTALEQHQKRQNRMAELESLATQWVGTLDDQDQGIASLKKKRGRKLSDSGTKARFYRAVCDAHFAHIIKVDLKAELFSYAVDEKALALAQMMDGKLLVVTNVRDMDAPQVIQACADNGNQAPVDLSPFLPWAMDEARLAAMRAVPAASAGAEVFDTS